MENLLFLGVPIFQHIRVLEHIVGVATITTQSRNAESDGLTGVCDIKGSNKTETLSLTYLGALTYAINHKSLICYSFGNQ